ncbi:MFS transporter [Allonocardiopsis opalescens]|uniref:Na+/melibiose symporter-like transporter n=1 Tax=Allonocardiopsis opalescens TaxID=1144618 RepID=A0A2T0QF35_9ACTN|nr:MFS transporter [Allonocardiopsis opalescens]PRY02547.1 Na+/melibiose symporter-like transporter [Allonocardiopsis opalescens]
MESDSPSERRVPWWAILLALGATFGTMMAAVVPTAFSLALRVEELAPGRTEVLGFILSAGAAATLVMAPITGIVSDRTRSRWGKRRPFTVIGAFVGAGSIPLMTGAPDTTMLTLGWVLSTVGWSTASASVGNWKADRLPPGQRGKVSGLTALITHIAPVVGIILVSSVRDHTWLVFLIPAVVGSVGTALFVVLIPEPSTRDAPPQGGLQVGEVLRSYLFRPRDAPDFAWVWLGRFVFFMGLTLTTSFTVYMYAQRLALPVADIAPVLALTSSLGIITTTIGSVGGGWISDRIGRRRPLVLVGAALFATGGVVSAFAHDLVTLVGGTLLSSMGIAAFTAVGQALLLDVLPHRETQAGRYMATMLLAQKIPGVTAPLLTPLILAVGGGPQNFTLLYLVMAVLGTAGGTVIAFFVRGAR